MFEQSSMDFLDSDMRSEHMMVLPTLTDDARHGACTYVIEADAASMERQDIVVTLCKSARLLLPLAGLFHLPPPPLSRLVRAALFSPP